MSERRLYLVFTPGGSFTDVVAESKENAVAQVEREERAYLRRTGQEHRIAEMPKPRVVESRPLGDEPTDEFSRWEGMR